MEVPFEINVAVDTQGHYAINNAPVSATDSPALADELKRISNEKGDSGKIRSSPSMPTAWLRTNRSSTCWKRRVCAGFDKVTFAHTSGKK